MADPLVAARSLGFRFAASGWIFREVGFTLPAGQVLAIIGQNGCGKTTLLKTVLGLLKAREGRVDRTGITGYVPQSVRSSVNFSVLEMVVMGRARSLALFRSPRAEDFRIARESLEMLGIDHLATRGFGGLSGGERQLVLVAQALAGQCELMILDEPTAALDFHNQEAILRLLHDLPRRRNMAIVFTTHNPEHAALIADQTLAMTREGAAVCGPTKDILVDDRLMAIYDMEVRNVSFSIAGRPSRSVLPIFRLEDEAA